MGLQTNKSGRHFATMSQMDVPQGRKGKHKSVVSAIIADLDHLQKGAALRIELAELGDTKENVRSALNRATRKLKRNVATASDGQFLYVWTVND